MKRIVSLISAGFLFIGPVAAQTGIEFLVNKTTAGDQRDADVATLHDESIVFVWEDHSQSGDDSDSGAIRAQILNTDGDLLASDLLINSTTIKDQRSPRVAAVSPANGGPGGFVVAWTDSSETGADTNRESIRARRFDSKGAPLGIDFVVNETTHSTQAEPRIAGLTNGNFVVVWTDYGGMSQFGKGDDTENTAVRGQLFDQIGAPIGLEFRVNTSTKREQQNAEVAALSNGEFIVAWQDLSQPFDGFEIRTQRFDENGAKLGPELQVNTTSKSADVDPSVTTFSDGGFAISWAKQMPTGPAMLRAFKPNGVPHGVEIALHDSGPTLSSATPFIKATAAGEIFAISSGNSSAGADTSDRSIWARQFTAAGAPVGSSFLVNATTSGMQYRPRADVLSDGRIVAAWTDSSLSADDASGRAVRACIIDPSSSAACTLAPVVIDLTTDIIEVGVGADGARAPRLAAVGGGSAALIVDSPSGISLRIIDAAGAVGDAQVLATSGPCCEHIDISPRVDGFMVAWAQSADGAIYAQRFDASGAPVPRFNGDGAFQVSPPGGAAQTAPAIGALGPLNSNRSLVAWEARAGSDTIIRGRRLFSEGQFWNTEFPVSLATGANFGPDVARLKNNWSVVVWEGRENVDSLDPPQIFARRIRAPSDASSVISVTNDSVAHSDASVFAAGDGFVVVWREGDGAAGPLFGRRHDGNGAPVGNVFAVTPASAAAHGADRGDAAGISLADGGFFVVWPGADGAVHGRRFDATGAPMGKAAMISNTSGAIHRWPDVALVAPDVAMVAWEDAGEIRLRHITLP